MRHNISPKDQPPICWLQYTPPLILLVGVKRTCHPALTCTYVYLVVNFTLANSHESILYIIYCFSTGNIASLKELYHRLVQINISTHNVQICDVTGINTTLWLPANLVLINFNPAFLPQQFKMWTQPGDKTKCKEKHGGTKIATILQRNNNCLYQQA